ncbi:hypothetical protein JNUCC75_01525 [Bifidobacterium polysaccharolyticum]|uniref:hypothetical protein n=1 Tax=Bifidobacterium polysaccharolyticum TaxID=2750967 RepID=UPI0021BA8C48|nr:hypothetical protein [Bifidobacterium polysaccharolyticum]MCT8156912.1 hypothetical protein [Bifidobacterium polysaccharolyticum]
MYRSSSSLPALSPFLEQPSYLADPDSAGSCPCHARAARCRTLLSDMVRQSRATLVHLSELADQALRVDWQGRAAEAYRTQVRAMDALCQDQRVQAGRTLGLIDQESRP